MVTRKRSPVKVRREILARLERRLEKYLKNAYARPTTPTIGNYMASKKNKTLTSNEI